ncbi:MAG: DEAD/DEAH box helicase [candidate division WOR-3 bacterium]
MVLLKVSQGYLVANIPTLGQAYRIANRIKKSKVITRGGISVFFPELDKSALRHLFFEDPRLEVDIKVFQDINFTLDDLVEDFSAALGEDTSQLIDFNKYTDLELFDYQKRTIDRAVKTLGFGIFFEMRCGKTITALVASSYLFDKQKIDSVFLVSPISAVQGWRQEVQKVKHPPIHHLYFPEATRSDIQEFKELQNEKVLRIAHINYEYWRRKNFDNFVEEIIPTLGRYLFILDESHKVKNPASKVHNVLYPFAAKSRTLLLTGTPIGNSIEDLWAQGRFIGISHLLGRSLSDFRKEYMSPVGGSTFKFWVEKRGSKEKVFDIYKYYSVSVKQSDVYKEQRVFHEILSYKLTNEQERLYDSVLDEITIQLESGILTLQNALKKALKLLQISSGFVINDGGEIESFHTPKDAIVLDLIETYEKEPTVIWTIFDYEGDKLQDMLTRHKIPAITVDGRTPPEKRPHFIDKFKERKFNVLITKPSVLSLGVDLSNARLVIFYSRNFSLIEREQAMSRILNPNVKGAVAVIDLLGSPIEYKVFEALKEKKELSDSLKDITSLKNFLRSIRV